MPKRAIIIAVIAIGIAVAAIFTSGFGLWSGEDAPPEFYGNVDIREVDLAFEQSGRITHMNFDEGQRVEKGAVLAVIDQQSLSDDLRAAQARLASAKAQLVKSRNGNRPQEIGAASAQLEQARAQLRQARSEYERRRGLVASGAVSRAQFEQSRESFDVAQAAVDSASQQLSLLRAGSRREDIAANVAAVEQAEADVAQAKTQLGEGQLIAPSGGIILSRVQEPGAITSPGATIYTLTIDKPVYIRAYAPEPQLGLLAPGTKVDVTTDSSDKIYRGTIGYVSPSAEFTPKTVQTEDLRSDLVYRFRVVVQNPDSGLRQGQPVTITLVRTKGRKQASYK
ncbi:MAG: HlyD family efflux transporter periplasmic adaptor subunit [Parasphingorhabdus sp.]|uniref:HlyD family efflux transporter periplasmic adaptor subunit n=1 Tax=Parasphingorhabdus sp. TaxID=2709688 RepID=UPI0030038062